MADQELTDKQQKNLAHIHTMSHAEMARLFRHAPAGHPYFVSDSVETHAFFKRFEEFGGMTPELSKQIGW